MSVVQAAPVRFATAMPDQITENVPSFGSLEAAKGYYVPGIEQYNNGVTATDDCHLNDWTWNKKDPAGIDHVLWTATKNEGAKCGHNPAAFTMPITAICPTGYNIVGDGVDCVCPAGKEEVIALGRCEPPCPQGTFRGAVSGLCKKRCPAGEYLSTSGLCRPWPPCPDAQSCLPPDYDPEQGPPDACAGNPINVANGNKFQAELDLQWAPDLQFWRYYNSRGETAAGMARGWSHSYAQRIHIVYKPGVVTPSDLDPDYRQFIGLTSTQVHRYDVVRAEGQSYAFSTSGQPLGSVTENIYKLTVLNNGFELVFGAVTETYDASGKLLSISTKGGSRQTLTYDAEGSLLQVADSRGFKLVFARDSKRRIIGVSTPKAAIFIYYTYAADQNAQLLRATRSGNLSRTYHYESPVSPFLLTGITDESNNRFATWSYDASGRAISSEHAGGIDRVTLDFSESSDAAGLLRSVIVTDVLGAVRTSAFRKIGGKWRLTSNSQPGGAGCAAAVSHKEYDPTHGTLKSVTDFRGNKTVYVIDPVSKLETSRTEAYGTPRARTISTVWDTALRKPKSIIEARQRTDYDYSPSTGRLNWSEVSDTTASPVVKRRTTYTYSFWDTAGERIKQVKMDGPRTDVDDSVTLDYDANGYLILQTRMVGGIKHETRWSEHDGGGRPTLMKTPDGRTTAFRYNGRGQVTSRTEGVGSSKPLTTTYSYLPTGKLEKVSFASGATITYGYDTAQRLTKITDGKGNYIHYLLDKAGNIIEETVNDKNAMLQALVQDIQYAMTQYQPQTEGL